MPIDGKALAEHILEKLRGEIVELKQQGLTPTLAVIQVGDDPASGAYIRQKKMAAEQIGAVLHLCHVSSITRQEELQKIIRKYNNDTGVHGIILQRPLPAPLSTQTMALCRLIDPTKDIDGFLPNSPYSVPVASAVIAILGEVHHLTGLNPVMYRVQPLQNNFTHWLHQQRIVILGRGDTAGKPIAEMLIKRGCLVTVVHSKTPNPDEGMKTADILVSCVGKSNVVRRDNIKKGVILISVGIHRDQSGKLHGDYREEEIQDTATCFTPTPGGVGPVNVACLMANLLAATKSPL
ncbi:bifunctional 5,10-methylenetetrahydrofolate dehydrogenase/5,10-methenyltetrahydrofolate cyclohydrolase [Candidatus Gottesmanbacteria bacterium]|nr:bifunctional 5,10-methylenetetrahydrofolate dehydrogenase/5,10-methenyltetrahydrofolate cyclohydrolase [Candidatus Gottesmanbacteria bacterium]